MPSHHPHHSYLHSFSKGVKKPQFTPPPSSSYKNFFHVFQKKNHGPAPSTSIFSGFLPQWFTTPSIMVPMSNIFESSDCIWYHGTVYVKEAVAVARMQQCQCQCQCQCQVAQPEPVAAEPEPTQLVVEPVVEPEPVHSYGNADDDDDDTESVCSNGSHNSTSYNSYNSQNSQNSTNIKPGRNIGKQNQLKYLKDGMLLRHMVLSDKWLATFDSETNRIIRVSDGVAFDTLRQFARLHCNEVDSSFTTANVWSDPHFQYQDSADGQWHPLANLKKK